MLIGGEQFVSIVEYYRLVWIGGRFGGHKTSFAFRVARDFLDRGYRLITNAKSIWTDEMQDVKLDEKTKHLHAVVILDEGGLSFKAKQQVETIAAYANKMDVIFMFPSFFPPTRAAQVVVAQPVFSFHNIGLPLVVFKWRVKIAAFEDSGTFMWFKPSEVYGVYSRQDPGAKATEIVRWLHEKTVEFEQAHGHSGDDGLPEMAVSPSQVLLDAAEELAGAVDAAALLARNNRKARR
jgi:hypothetical protein